MNNTQPNFALSSRKTKKYMVITPSNNIVHFGDRRYQQFHDKLGAYSHLDHNDPERRQRYLKRAKGIRNKDGKLTWKDKESANYYAVKYLW